MPAARADIAAPLHQLRKAAARFLDQAPVAPVGVQAGEQLDACAAHLVDVFAVAEQLAAELALAAWAELLARPRGARFDLAASTQHLVWIDDAATGQRRAVAVTDLLRMMGPRPVPAAGRPGPRPDLA